MRRGAEEVAYSPRRVNINVTLKYWQIRIPTLLPQLCLLHACVIVPLLHHVNNAKPTDQSTKRTLFETMFECGWSPVKQCKTIVTVSDMTVRAETVSSWDRSVRCLES
jgi:hypothetical protein